MSDTSNTQSLIKSTLVSVLLLLLNSSIAVSRPSSPEEICSSELTTAIDTIINRPQFQRSRWGILVETLSNSTPLYSRDPQHYFIPASTVKLITTAAILQELGSDFRIKTSIYSDNNGIFAIVGRGDPSLTTVQLKDLAQQLKNQGINTINQLIADESYFTGFSVHPNWEWEDVQAGYGAPINSLILHQNSLDLILSPQAVGQPLKVTWVRPTQSQGWLIENNSVTVKAHEREFVKIGRDLTSSIIRVSGQLRVGSESEPVYAAVVEPTLNFIQEFRNILETEGIQVNQVSIGINDLNQTQEIARIESPPVSELIQEVNLESNNVFIGALVRILGVQQPSSNALESGLNTVKEVLSELGVDSESYHLVDSSGLSRQNLVSPEALVQTLKVMSNLPLFEVYKKSLPIAGVSGTLKERFKQSSATGIVFAKTGTLTGVSALAGYIESPDYSPLVFSILVNNSNLSTRELRTAIDNIVLTLTKLRRC